MTLRFLPVMMICWLCSFGLSAQSKFFLDVSGTYSLDQEVVATNMPSYYQWNRETITEHFEARPGMELNLGFRHNIYKKFDLITGIGLSAFQFDKTVSVDIQTGDPYGEMQLDYTPFYGYPVGFEYYEPVVIAGDPRALFDRGYNWLYDYTDQDRVGQTEILYVNIPLGIQYPLTDKLLVGVGIKDAILTYSKQVRRDQYNRAYTDQSSDGLTNNLISGDIGLQYNVFKQLWLSTSYNHHFTAAYDEGSRLGEGLKYKTFKIGVKYNL